VAHSFLDFTELSMTFVQAIFLLSPDTKFSDRGATTGINYSDRFKTYKRFIIKAIDTPGIAALFAHINKQVLQIQPPDNGVTAQPTVEQQDSDEDELFRAFQDKATLSRSLKFLFFHIS
jgi:hypothetical protein